MSARPTPVVLVTLAAVLAGGLGSLSSCGSPQDDYCAAVAEHRDELADLASRDTPQAALGLLGPFTQLSGDAPVDVADDWDLVVGRLRDLRGAAERADVDLATYDARHPPEGLAADRKADLTAAADALAAPDTRTAMSVLAQEVRDVCHTPLGL